MRPLLTYKILYESVKCKWSPEKKENGVFATLPNKRKGTMTCIIGFKLIIERGGPDVINYSKKKKT